VLSKSHRGGGGDEGDKRPNRIGDLARAGSLGSRATNNNRVGEEKEKKGKKNSCSNLHGGKRRFVGEKAAKRMEDNQTKGAENRKRSEEKDGRKDNQRGGGKGCVVGGFELGW